MTLELMTDADTNARVTALIDAHHRDLAKAEARVNVLFSSAAMKAASTTAITPPKIRAMLPIDAVITIERERWEDSTEPQRDAILDQALARLTVVLVTKRDDAGKVVYLPGGEPEMEAKRDEHDRVKLRMRKPSRVIEVFDDVAMRHGEHSVEAAELREFAETETGQLLMFSREGDVAKLGAKVASIDKAAIKRRAGREPSVVERALSGGAVGVVTSRAAKIRRGDFAPDTPRAS